MSNPLHDDFFGDGKPGSGSWDPFGGTGDPDVAKFAKRAVGAVVLVWALNLIFWLAVIAAVIWGITVIF